MPPARRWWARPFATACSGASAAAPTPRCCKAASSGPSGAPARSLSSAASAMMAIAAAFSAAARCSGAARVSLLGAASAASILSTRAARAERSGPASFVVGGPASSFATPRGEVRNFGARGVDLGFCVRNLLRQALGGLGCGGDTGSVLGVCRLERAHALVEFRAAGRRGARLQRAHALVEARDGAALAFGFGVQSRCSRAAPASRVQPAGPRSLRDRLSRPRNNSRRRRQARKRSAPRARRPRKHERQCGQALRPAPTKFEPPLRSAPGDGPTSSAPRPAISPSMTPGSGRASRLTGAPARFGRNVLGFLVDHRLASSIFRGLIYGRPQGKETR